jgi:hypothetical protein
VEEEEGAEGATISVLATQMSHCFPHSPQTTTYKIAQVGQIAVITPEGVV